MPVLLALLVAIFVLGPITAVIEAATASKYWEWFVAPQYGEGPTFATWYGIMCVFSLLTIGLAKKMDTKNEKKSIWIVLLEGVLTVWASCGLSLIAARVVGGIAGWM